MHYCPVFDDEVHIRQKQNNICLWFKLCHELNPHRNKNTWDRISQINRFQYFHQWNLSKWVSREYEEIFWWQRESECYNKCYLGNKRGDSLARHKEITEGLSWLNGNYSGQDDQ